MKGKGTNLDYQKENMNSAYLGFELGDCNGVCTFLKVRVKYLFVEVGGKFLREEFREHVFGVNTTYDWALSSELFSLY